MNYRYGPKRLYFLLPPYLLNRLSGFGFLASEEVKAAGVGNLGLQDREYAQL